MFPFTQISKFRARLSRKQAAGQIMLWQTGYEHMPSWDMTAEIKEGYEQNSVVFACVNCIVVGGKGIPWILQKKARRGSRITEVDDPANPVLALYRRPNPFQAWSSFFEDGWNYWLTTGNSMLKGSRVTAREMKEVSVLRSNLIGIKTDGEGRPTTYNYKITQPAIHYKAEDVLHLRSGHSEDDPLFGLSPVRVGSRVIDQDNNAVEWNRNLLKNRGCPDFLFIFPNGLTPEQRIEFDKWREEKFSGSANAGKPVALDAGEFKIEKLSSSPVELDYVAGTNLTHRRICQCYGVPSELIGDPQNRTYSNQQEARLALYEQAIFPRMDHFRDEWNRWVVEPYDERLWFEYDKDAVDVIQEKRKTAFERVQTADWLSVNEQREATGYETFTDEDTDDNSADVPRFLLQQNAFKDLGATVPGMEDEEKPEDEGSNEDEKPAGEQDGGAAGEQAEEAQGEETEKKPPPKARRLKQSVKYWKLDNEEKSIAGYRQMERQREVFEQFYTMQLRKHFRQEREAVRKAVEANSGEKAEAAIRSVLATQGEGLATIYRELYVNVSKFFFTFVYRTLMMEKSLKPKAKKEVAQATREMRVYLRAEVPKRVGAIQETSLEKLTRILREGIMGGQDTGKIADQIEGVYDEQFIPNRAEMIAGNEVVQMSNLGSEQGAKATGLELRKYWITQRDTRVRGETNPNGEYRNSEFDHWKADHQSRDLEEPFMVTGEEMDFPGDTSMGASLGNVINCRCFLAYDDI